MKIVCNYHLYATYQAGALPLYIYNSPPVDINTLTYNTIPALGTLIGTYSPVNGTYNIYDIPVANLNSQYIAITGAAQFKYIYMDSAEGANRPYFTYDLPTGSLYITSTPSEAEIFVDDIDTTLVTPSTIPGLSEGIHTYKLVSGTYIATGSFTINAGITTNVPITISVVAASITSDIYMH